MGNHTLVCTFNNGERRKIDLTPLLKYPAVEALKKVEEAFAIENRMVEDKASIDGCSFCIAVSCLLVGNALKIEPIKIF